MLKSFFWGSLFMLAVMMAMPASLAVPLDAVSNPQQVNGGWVMDRADLLSDTTEATLNQMLSQLNAQNGTEVMVVTVPETSPSKTPQQFASELFDRWNIGQSEEKPGALFLISKQERRVEIKTGLRAIMLLPNHRVSHIIGSQIIPQFKQGKFDKGILAGTTAIVAALKPHNSFFSLNSLPLWSKSLIPLVMIGVFTSISWALGYKLRPKLEDINLSDDDILKYREYYREYLGSGSNATFFYRNGGGHSGGGYSGGGCSGGGAGGSW